jgi:hypothetical protein
MDLLAGQPLGLQDLPPPRVGLADQRLTVQLHDVEDQVGHRDGGQQARRGRGHVHPALQGGKARAAAGERGDLPVQDHRPGPGPMGQVR